MPKNLTDHFTLEEFLISQTAARENIDNTPSSAVIENLKKVAALLEEIRSLLGNKPLNISSGYRSPALNAKVGGAANSRHVDGLAVDFTVPSFGDPYKVALAIANSNLQYKQLIHEFGTWVHIGLPKEGEDRKSENLSIFHGTGCLTGILPVPK